MNFKKLIMETVSQKASNFIKKAIASNQTVYIGTRRSVKKITPAIFTKWTEAKRDLFIIDKEGNLRMAAGKRYDIIVTKHNCLVNIQAQ